MEVTYTESVNGWLFVITDNLGEWLYSAGMYPTKEEAIEKAEKVLPTL